MTSKSISAILFCLFGWAFCPCQSTETISLGEKHHLHSKTLNEEREFWIYLPRKARENPEQRFPVLYLLDGENYFHTATGVVSHLSELNGNAIVPDMIVVGIVNVDRNRDFTPSEDPASRLPSTGGGEAFLTFLRDELRPHVDTHFPTAPYNLLVGHSLGGLLSVHTLLHHSGDFNAYLALDPSLWWKDMELVAEAEELLEGKNLEGKSLFLGIAKSFPASMDAATALKDTGNASLGYRSIRHFEKSLKDKSVAKLRWSSKYYPEESHGSIPLLGLHDGLKAIFDFYKRPSFAQLTDESPDILEEHYAKISKKMGYLIPPPERTLVGLAWRCRALEQNYERALRFLELGEKFYPESVDLYSEYGQWHLGQGNQAEAEKYYWKAQDLNRKQQEK